MGFPWFTPNVEKLKARGDADGLVRALEKDAVRDAAVAALIPLGEKALRPVLAALSYEGSRGEAHDRALCEVAGSLGTPAVEPVLSLLGRGGEQVKRRALAVLGRLGDRRAAGAVRSAIQGAGLPYLKCDALQALAAISGSEHVDVFVEALSDDNGVVRRDAAKLLGSMGDRAVVPALRALWGRVGTLDLETASLAEVEDVLGKQRPSDNPNVGMMAAAWLRMQLYLALAGSLAMLGEPDATQALLRVAATEQHPLFHHAAQEELRRVVAAGALSAADQTRAEVTLRGG